MSVAIDKPPTQGEIVRVRSRLAQGHFDRRKGTTVFRSLAERMVARPGLHVQLFLHIGREWRDTRDESELLREFGAELSGLPGF